MLGALHVSGEMCKEVGSLLFGRGNWGGGRDGHMNMQRNGKRRRRTGRILGVALTLAATVAIGWLAGAGATAAYAGNRTFPIEPPETGEGGGGGGGGECSGPICITKKCAGKPGGPSTPRTFCGCEEKSCGLQKVRWCCKNDTTGLYVCSCGDPANPPQQSCQGQKPG